MSPALQIALVHAFPLELDSAACRGLRWLRDELTRRGARVEAVTPADPGALGVALATAGVVCAGELRPCEHELAVVSALARCPAPLVLLPQGYPFCEIGTRVCPRCPLRLRCESTHRVAAYRHLFARAARVVYLSPLHRRACEGFLGAHPGALTLAPPDPWPLPAGGGEGSAAFPNPNDPGEWERLREHCLAHPGEVVSAYADELPPGDLPDNLRPVRLARSGPRGELLARHARLVLLPERPLPFGQDAAAMLLAGRGAALGEAVGLAHWLGPEPGAGAIQALVDEARRELPGLVLEAGSALPAPAPQAPRFGRVLLWAHGLGLGDSINLLPFARSLAESCREGLTWALPARHATLLEGALDASLQPHEELDPEQARARFELVVEVSVYRDRLYAGDLVDERWLQLELARPSNGFQRVHENLLDLLASAGLPARPERPRLALRPEERRAAEARLSSAGLDARAGLVLAVHPGAGAAVKRWPPGRFGELCRWARRELGAGLVLLGGPEEDALLDAVLAAEPGAALVSRGEPLREVAALLQACTALACNDSGLMHLACAVDTPVLALFGPSSEHVWGPSAPLAQVVAPAGGGPGRRALDALGVSEVATGLAALLGRIAAAPPGDVRRLLARSPSARREQLADGWGWAAARGQARLACRGAGDPVALLLETAARPVAYAELCAAHGAALVELALVAGLLAPPWAAAALGGERG
ncbi:MAG TPA: glycosyltransferase family 9 protein [Myxococcota bacterium]|nr:glycosyltransferase family 9 protein [Myxococcota bacterium]HRY97080.1 glycosyltransferase family 9 protein [Myxococcota bacterium]HSA21119.1 glycosyltransferase family 9 protein [Myxococcota bacterium]